MGPNLPKGDFSIGPGISYLYDSNIEKSGKSLNLDIAYTYYLFSYSTNFKYINIGNESLFGFQAEISFWLIFNYGLGIGYLWGNENSITGDFYIGLPFWILGKKSKKFLGVFHYVYLEPYYKINILQNRNIHETGILIKITTANF